MKNLQNLQFSEILQSLSEEIRMDKESVKLFALQNSGGIKKNRLHS